MGQVFTEDDLESVRTAFMNSGGDSFMFQRTMPIMVTDHDIDRLGSFSDTQTIRVEEDGTVIHNGVAIGHHSKFMMPIKVAGTPVTIQYKTNPSAWIPTPGLSPKRIVSKQHKQARKKIAKASRKRNRK